jgi:chromosome segregation protein
MRIRKLELHGFKSFPDRTVLTFDPGISCIVGPNGCGKSNIVDALRWCIGEQSARSLRGDDMLDVIFAGSQIRKPVGFAEVGMTLTTEGGEPFPGEYAQLLEVSVGRRLHRTGAAEYFINQRRVRRRDIVDFFLDTGVGNNLYSFIEQGRIGKIVHARPEERRTLIDEAAGISRYKIRREEARERLVATAAQLDRASDVAEEMARRERQLSRQVLKAAHYRHLRARIRLDEVALAIAKDHALTLERRALRASHRATEAELETIQRRRARREADLVERRAAIDIAEAAIESGRDRIADLDGRLRELDGTIAYSRRRAHEAEERRKQAEEVRASSASEAVLAESEHAVAEKASAEAQEHAVAARTERQFHEASAAQVGADLELARVKVKDLRTKAVEAEVSAQRLTAERNELAEREALLPARTEEAERGVRDAVGECDAASATREAARDRWVRSRTDAEAAQSVWEAARSTEQAARDAEAEVGSLLDAAEGERTRSKAAFAARVAQVERTAREAEAAWERAGNQAQHEMERELSVTRRELDARAGRDRALLDQELVQARARAERWLVAWEQKVKADRTRADQASRQREQEVERQRSVRLAEARGQAEAMAKDAEQTARADYQAQVQALESQVHILVQEEAAARTTLTLARQARDVAHRALASLGAEIARCEAVVRGAGSADQGAAAVRTALPAFQPLIEGLSEEARREPSILAMLGERALVPRVSEPADILVAADAARSKGRTSVMFRPSGPLDVGAAVGTGVRVVDSLEDALREYLASPNAFVVRSTGERIDADGRVWVGPSASEGAAVLDALQQAERGREQLSAQKLVVERADADLERAEQVCSTSEQTLAEARRLRASRLQELDAGLEQAVRAAREAARTAVEEVRLEVESQRERALALGRAEQEAALREEEARRADLRAMRDEALRRVEGQVAAAVDTLRTRTELALTEARDQAREKVETAIRKLDEVRKARRSEVEAVRQETADPRLDEAVDSARLLVAEARRHVEATRLSAADASERRSRAEIFATRAEATAKAAEEASRRAEEALAAASSRLSSIHEEEAILRARVELTERRLTEARSRAEALGGQATVAEQELAGLEERLRGVRDQLQDARLREATSEERWKSQAKAAIRSLAQAEAARQRETAAAASVLEAGDAAAEAVAQAAESEIARASAADERAVLWDRWEKDRKRVGGLREEFRTGEQDLRALGESEAKLVRERDLMAGQVDAARAEVDALRQRIEERYQLSVPALLDQIEAAGRIRLDVDAAVAQPFRIEGTEIPGVDPEWVDLGGLLDESGIASRVQRLAEARRDLERLGEVNLAAFEEYAEIHARYTDLEAQRADLEASVEAIRTAIASLNKTCRQRFRDTFDLVNQHFQEMYPRLVGGGSGRLALTDEEDLLEAGVEIYVQPPGKRLQNLSLLSGGEKAMTAIALILSLFKVKPSPFCVLDEVDAPLDEANGSRFNEALKEMSAFSQFIVVTHNRKTMECAATLYGITMPDPGVSRLVSVRLGD